jgi:Zn-dependent protease
VGALATSAAAHELGHAVAARRLGLAPRVLLHGLGGQCQHRPVTGNGQIGVILAGPAASLALGVLAAAALAVWPEGTRSELFVWDLAWMNLAATAVNLLPALPLDGGLLARNLLERSGWAPNPAVFTRVLGVSAAVGAMLGAIWLAQPVLVSLFAMLAWFNAEGLGWVPKVLAPVPPDPRRADAEPGLTPAIASLLALLMAPTVLGLLAGIDPAPAGMVLRPGLDGWLDLRLLTWPLAARGDVAFEVGALVTIGLVGPPLERRIGGRGIVALAMVATPVAGVAAALAAAGLATRGALGGAVPLAVTLVAAWAVRPGRPAIGLSPIAVLGLAISLALLSAWSHADGPAAAAALASAGIGVLSASWGRAERRARRLEVPAVRVTDSSTGLPAIAERPDRPSPPVH